VEEFTLPEATPKALRQDGSAWHDTYLQSVGLDRSITHKDIKVKDIMEKVEDWLSVELKNVGTITVQGVLDAFQKTGRTHLPVLDTKEGKEHHLCGLFSSAKTLRLTDLARRNASHAK
jgi:hypothetical protein